MEELNEQVVNSKSKSVYLYGIVKYILWLHADNPDIIDLSLWILVSSVVAEDDDKAYKQKQQHVKAYMASNSTQSPVNLLVAKMNDFECFLMSLRKKDGKSPGKLVYLMESNVSCWKFRFNHLEWDKDSLAIWFGHMKNDQEGDRQRDPIFAPFYH
ncbi:hypothetical protein GQ600_27538 [Phytophthora cactorum]|nr:hypothetical protein GQ600_27538 [Phytophthora cactorum]